MTIWLSKAPILFPDHKQRLDEFHARGELLLAGAFGDPQTEGSMGIVSSRRGVEEFIASDPFVRGGAVKAWQIRQWHESLGWPVRI